MASTATELAAAGLIGGRTVRIVEGGSVDCFDYPLAPLSDGDVRVQTFRSAISPGTEMTFYGPGASNAYLHKTWDEDLRLFVAGSPSLAYPVTFGYRAAGRVVESADPTVSVGTRLFGNWRHTEFTVMPGEQARTQLLPDGLSWDDGVDLGQMGPICVNAVAFAEGLHRGRPSVVFGAGPIGLITAQILRAEGSDPVYIVDRLPERLSIAEGLGLHPLQASEGADLAVALKRRHGSEGIPVAIEGTGSASALHEAIRVVRRVGLVVAMGFYQGDAVGLRLGEEFHHNGVRVASGQIGNIHASHTMASLRDYIQDLALEGSVVLGGLPRVELPVEEAARGFDALKRPAETLQVTLSYDAR
jgi:NADPH:quinone reductase-like Zn-dependent oxidoreductase